MIYTVLTNKALRMAYRAHSGQTDSCGVPYIFHPYHLAEQMTEELACCTALLHDVLEDTPITAKQLRTQFPSAVVDAVEALTRKKGEDYFDYISRLKPNPIARKVKLADLAHNVDISRMAGQNEDPSWAARREKYAKAKAILLE